MAAVAARGWKLDRTAGVLKLYQVGNLIYYGNTGVCRITDNIGTEFFWSCKGQIYYTLEPICQSCVIHTPVNSDKTYMRHVISEDEAERIIDMIPSIKAESYHNKASSQLAEHDEASFKTHDCADLIELAMSIYAKKTRGGKEKSQVWHC